MLFPVRPVVLEADSSPSGPVNDWTLEFRSSSRFSGGKEKVKKIEEIFFLIFWFLIFFHCLCIVWASIIATTINSCYHSYHVWYEKVCYHHSSVCISFIANRSIFQRATHLNLKVFRSISKLLHSMYVTIKEMENKCS